MPTQYHYQPINQTAFNAAVEKVATRLGLPATDVYYHFTMDPVYYRDGVDSDSFADAEFALGISDSQTYEDMTDHVKSVYGLTDAEVRELVASEKWFQEN
jgi:hypothetical protein